MSDSEIREFYADKAWDQDALKERGPALPFTRIAKDDRYLISEMACKSFEVPPWR
jgi:hypothetical protein